ncbi:MAG: ATP-binding protein [Candidatus Nealsonbacteria bacterium]
MAKKTKKKVKARAKRVKKTKSTYTAKDIFVLKGLEPVRKRPAMYIGSTGPDGLHHLIKEIVGNSIDEAIMGYCDDIKVWLLPNNRVKVEDNGRGIPVDRHALTKKSALETIMTTLHAGGKFGGKAYVTSGGLHGVGISVVCALSKYMKVEVCRDGYRYSQEYARGKKKTAVRKVGKSRTTGTIITFEPDEQIFNTLKFNEKKILNYLRQQAYLTKGVRITFFDQRVKPHKTYAVYFEGGIISYIKYLIRTSPPVNQTIFYCSGEKNGILVESAFRYTDDLECVEKTFANNVHTQEGGTHLTGFRSALTRTFNDYAKKNGFLKETDSNFTGEDTREGLTAVISIKLKDPQFEGQTKSKLGNSEAKPIVEQVVSVALADFLERNPNDARAIILKFALAQKARKAAKAAKDTILRKKILDGLALPGKLADCTSRNPEESEIFIVEGESAGGSSRQARDRHFQAILPLRGKILNVERARLDKILNSKEIKSLIIALGTAVSDDFDIEKARYHRIVIMCDADSVTGDTPILVYNKEKQEFFLTEVGEFIENCDDALKYQVLTYNSKTKKSDLKDIYQTIRHPRRTPLYEIKTYCGYPIKITSCHSIYVFENGKVVTKKGDKVKKGDILVFPKKLPHQEKEYVMDLEDAILNSGLENISVKVPQNRIEQVPAMAWCDLSSGSWNQLQKKRELTGMSRRVMGELIKVYDRVVQQWEQKIDNVMPRFHQFKQYLSQIEINSKGLDYNLYIPIKSWKGKSAEEVQFYYRNHSRLIKTKFKLGKDLSYLIGFYLGDGYAAFQKKNPNRFSISLNKENSEQYIKKLSQIIEKKFGAKAILDYAKNTNSIDLHFHSLEFKLLLTQLGLLKKKCNEKFIPNTFFNVEKSVQESLIEGLLHSDGFITVWPKDKPRKAIYGWRLSSEKLIQGIMTIFRQWGIFPAYSVSRSKNHFRKDGKLIRSNFKSYDLSVSTVEYLVETKNVWLNHKDSLKLKEYLKKVNYKKLIGKYLQPISQDFIGLKVRNIEKVKNPDNFVYDFSVCGDQNFVAGLGGTLLHNSDGNHIKTLLLTLFYRYFKPLIERGYLYLAQPPLYKIQAGKKIDYAYTESQSKEIIKSFGKNTNISIQRYKGLGEMNAGELWDTTMDPENRTLLQVNIDDEREADRIFDILMGKEVLPRKKFIQSYAKQVKNLDV